MSTVQRLIIVLGVLAVVYVVFVMPPLEIIGQGDRWVDARAFCTGQAYNSGAFSARAFDNGRYQECIANASWNFRLLGVYLGVIVLLSSVLVWAFKPKRNVLSVLP